MSPGFDPATYGAPGYGSPGYGRGQKPGVLDFIQKKIATLGGAMGLGSAGDIKALQTALKLLATIPKYSRADPGAADGVLGPKTLTAIASVIAELPGDKVPAAVKFGISVGLPILISQGPNSSMAQTAKKYIEQYASSLAVAVTYLAQKSGADSTGGVQATVHYPVGTGYAFDPKVGAFRVAIPIGSTLSGGALSGPTAVEAPSVPTPPSDPNAVQIPLPTLKKRLGEVSWYEDWRVWAGAGAAVALIGGGAYALRK
jgi:hypothetical protein